MTLLDRFVAPLRVREYSGNHLAMRIMASTLTFRHFGVLFRNQEDKRTYQWDGFQWIGKPLEGPMDVHTPPDPRFEGFVGNRSGGLGTGSTGTSGGSVGGGPPSPVGGFPTPGFPGNTNNPPTAPPPGLVGDDVPTLIGGGGDGSGGLGPYPNWIAGTNVRHGFCTRAGVFHPPFIPTAGKLLIMMGSPRGPGTGVTGVSQNVNWPAPGAFVDNGWTVIRAGNSPAPSSFVLAKIATGTENVGGLRIDGVTDPNNDVCIFELSATSLAAIQAVGVVDVTTGAVQSYTIVSPVGGSGTLYLTLFCTTSNTIGLPPTRGWHDTFGMSIDYEYDNDNSSGGGLYPATLMGHGTAKPVQTTYTRNDGFPMDFEAIQVPIT